MPTLPAIVPGPAHVKLGYWAVAGGTVGYPVHILFRDYPTWVVAELFARYTAAVGSRRTVYVTAERDLRVLEQAILGEDANPPRLVLLTDPKLVARTGWLLASLRAAVADGSAPTPTLLATCQCGDRHEGPGPALTLHGASSQVSLAMKWLDCGEQPEPLPTGSLPASIDFNAVNTLFRPCEGHGPRPTLLLRDKQVLKGLLAGAALLRHARTSAGIQLAVGVEDYREVFGPLLNTATQSADAAFEPLTLAMVQRANVYLSLRDEADGRPGTTPGTDERGITRRELADLGNSRGTVVRTLVAALRGMGDEGLALYKTLGTIRPLKEDADWPAPTAEGLTALLLDWSVKQVRTHFERLLAEGLITGNRPAGNKHWVYLLPEVLAVADPPFKSLPMPEALGAPPAAAAGPDTRADQTS